jgi:hypothetical protein
VSHQKKPKNAKITYLNSDCHAVTLSHQKDKKNPKYVKYGIFDKQQMSHYHIITKKSKKS